FAPSTNLEVRATSRVAQTLQNLRWMPSTNAPVRYAVVGLGYIAQVAVLPAFAHARKNSVLQAIISGDPLKLKRLGDRYGVAVRGDYSQFESCLTDVDAVYIAT